MKWRKKVFFITFIAINLVDEPALEVTIEQGTLIGKTSSDRSYFEYLGIPYANVNSSTRFRAPGPPPFWEGTYRAVEEPPSCPQNIFIGIIGNEDCLRLNVYVPASAKQPFPVLVYIHGGAFNFGSGGKNIYGPNFLVQKEVIVVTFNYRVGILGFLCLRIKEAPGNAGIKDQIAALKWVKENIAAFGGDPDNITIFGGSSGAASVSLILNSKSATGLFKRAIIQSGSSLAPWAIDRNPLETARLLAQSAGYNTEDPMELYRIFSNMTNQELVTLHIKKKLQNFFETSLFYLPCVESNIPGVEPVITDMPINLIKTKPYNIDVMYGLTSKEGLFLIGSETIDSNLEQRKGGSLFAGDLQFHSEDEEFMISKQVKNIYFDEKDFSIKEIATISDIFGHLYFDIPVILESEYLLNTSQSKVFNYLFKYSGQRNFLKFINGFIGETGACHGDDIFYLFHGSLLPPLFTKEDKKVVNFMTTLWTNFAKHGNPTPDPKEFGVKWESSKKDNMKFLHIDHELKMGSIPNEKTYRFWRDIYDKYRIKH
ncbi:esterase FE4-like [Danaus plexippus]|uniref:esterase FE4-like n=1 Tax=Danaus plexippus TaxID=13037 RepID=UPI002AB0978C|nr:esterase FE4-like [Danaus plexippus]